jgi:hypothetical protein
VLEPIARYVDAGVPPEHLKDVSPIPEELHLFGRLEHLVGEEARLLAETSQHSTHEQHERLRAITEQLDRIWETMRERATRLGYPHSLTRHGS